MTCPVDRYESVTDDVPARLDLRTTAATAARPGAGGCRRSSTATACCPVHFATDLPDIDNSWGEFGVEYRAGDGAGRVRLGG